jgi:hypothetical protein
MSRLPPPEQYASIPSTLPLSNPTSSTQQNGTHPPSPPPRANTTPLTLGNLRQLQSAPSNLHTYLRRDQNFERVPLGLEIERRRGEERVEEFEERWRVASAG